MTLKEMCIRVAVETDRADDFVTIINKDGKEVYDPDDDPGMWYKCMVLGINNAYREVARRLLLPDTREEVVLNDNGEIELMGLYPGVSQVIAVYNRTGSEGRQFDFLTKFRIRVRGGKKDDVVQLHYNYVPEALERFTDEPEFPEHLVDPMVYISRAAADIWMMERKFQAAQAWENRYYSLLSSIRSDMRSAANRRIPKSRFR